MACKRTCRSQLLVAALLGIAVALFLPAAGHAAENGKVASAGVLARGSGYGTATGSDAVRVLQRRLRRLGTPPGPIDGLYGPLTEAAVQRFQQRHGLAVDGIVGRQTRRSLYTAAVHRAAAPTRQETPPDRLERKSPAPQVGAESAGEPQHVRPAPSDAASRAGPEHAPGVPVEVLAVAAGLALLLIAGLWWQRRRELEASLNLGLACAALLGVLVTGAAGGAIFATQAAPDGNGDANAQSGVILAGANRPDRTRSSAARAKRAQRAETAITLAAKPPASTDTPVAPASAPKPEATPSRPPAARASAPPVRAASSVVQGGDSPSGIARRELRAGSSSVSVAKTVEKLTDPGVDSRTRSGDPDLIQAGEGVTLP